MTLRQVRQAGRRTKLDRDTWAGTTLAVVSYDTLGVGSFETELIEFGVVYVGEPIFAYGVEAQEGQELIPDDFPFVTCGVKEWEVSNPEETQGKQYHLGAFVWISVSAKTAYRLRFRLSFEGIAFRNVEYFRGLNG